MTRREVCRRFDSDRRFHGRHLTCTGAFRGLLHAAPKGSDSGETPVKRLGRTRLSGLPRSSRSAGCLAARLAGGLLLRLASTDECNAPTRDLAGKRGQMICLMVKGSHLATETEACSAGKVNMSFDRGAAPGATPIDHVTRGQGSTTGQFMREGEAFVELQVGPRSHEVGCDRTSDGACCRKR